METYICQTDGCGNEGVPFEILHEEYEWEGVTYYSPDAVVCGPCGQHMERDGA